MLNAIRKGATIYLTNQKRKGIAVSGGLKEQKDEYSTKDNRSTQVEVWQVSRHCSNAVLAAGLVGIVIKKVY